MKNKDALEMLNNLIRKLISFGLLTDDEEKQAKHYLLKLEEDYVTDYIQFMQAFNKITGKKFSPDVESWELFYSNNIHSLEDRIKALRNAFESNWIQENIHVLTPRYILKKENISKFYEYKEAKNKKNKKKNDGTTKNKDAYNEIAEF